jgi:hypothetical protein
MVGDFTFSATMHDFFIIVIAFFGGMVMADGRGGRGRQRIGGQGEVGEAAARGVLCA